MARVFTEEQMAKMKEKFESMEKITQTRGRVQSVDLEKQVAIIRPEGTGVEQIYVDIKRFTRVTKVGQLVSYIAQKDETTGRNNAIIVHIGWD